MSIDQISRDVLDTSIHLHRELGPGLLESVYETVLAGKLTATGYRGVRQKPVDIVLEEQRNFGGATLKEGFKRLVNEYDPSASLRLCANQILS